MKKLIFTLTLLVGHSAFSAGLEDALSAAIKSSDTEKASTKVALNVSEDMIEKATFKRGQQKIIIKAQSNIISDNTYAPAETRRNANVDESLQIENLEKELNDKK